MRNHSRTAAHCVSVTVVIIVIVGTLTVTRMQCDAQIVSNQSSLEQPRGGEVYAAGEAIPITWDIKQFAATDLLQVEAWNINDGNWIVVRHELINTGSTSIVLGPMALARIRVVSQVNGVKSVMGGYIVVQARKASAATTTYDQNATTVTTVMVHELTGILSSPEMRPGNIEVYSYDGRLLASSDNPEDVIKMLDSDLRVLLQVTSHNIPKKILLLVLQ